MLVQFQSQARICVHVDTCTVCAVQPCAQTAGWHRLQCDERRGDPYSTKADQPLFFCSNPQQFCHHAESLPASPVNWFACTCIHLYLYKWMLLEANKRDETHTLVLAIRVRIMIMHINQHIFWFNFWRICMRASLCCQQSVSSARSTRSLGAATAWQPTGSMIR